MSNTLDQTEVVYDVLRRDGKEQFVVLKWEDYQSLVARLEDLDDLKLIERARVENDGAVGVTTDELKQRLGID
ncbi:MAG: hypothetical protein AAF656_04865 [Planctomycetota bacterium]